jgi:hypothetical protein
MGSGEGSAFPSTACHYSCILRFRCELPARLLLEREGPSALLAAARRHRPDGSLNPFHAPVRHGDEPAESQPVRRQCCLLYRLAGEGCCRTCPRLAPQPCRARFANHNHLQ